MSSHPELWGGTFSLGVPALRPTDTLPNVTEGKLTYGGFIFWLQHLGINPLSVRSNNFGDPIGQGRSFSVSRHRVNLSNRHAMGLTVSLPGRPPWSRESIPMNTYVAFKRIVQKVAGTMDVSDQGQLYAICCEINALIHPNLREHENIIKLQSIFWENGFGAGNNSDLPMWPTLVLEYCETNLADYQINNLPLNNGTKLLLGTKIASAVGSLHDAHIFHGDLKSENILIKIGENGAPEPKIADFGYSIVLERSKGHTRYYVGGTQPWCAPECQNYFTDEKAIGATDWYSFGLLLMRIDLDGKSPFEEINVIPTEWSEEEKITAIQCLKEDDCLYPLICDAYSPGYLVAAEDADNRNHVGCFLLADPVKRLAEIDLLFERILKLVPKFDEQVKSQNSGNNPDASMELVSKVLDHLRIDLDGLEKEREEEDNDGDEEEEKSDLLDLMTDLSSVQYLALVPEMVCHKLSFLQNPRFCLNTLTQYTNMNLGLLQEKISTTKHEGMLNSKTRSLLIEEILFTLKERASDPWNRPCAGCCALSRVDTEPHLLSVESLIDEIKRYISTIKDDLHTCQAVQFNDLPEESLRTQALWGGSFFPEKFQFSSAAYQLFLATATGFGTEKDSLRALEILEETVVTGSCGFSVHLCRYAQFMGYRLPMHLPLRKWLTTLVLFTCGIPSGAFNILSDIDPVLANTVRRARSKLYNGSSSTFEGMKLSGIHVINNSNGELEIPKRYLDAASKFEDDVFENTLLHLAAGAEGRDTLILTFCVEKLGIDIDTRNADGVTPLLMACRAGRETKILALLDLGANVTLTYTGGETPLHWLGLLPQPGPLLERFLAHGADINAHVYQSRSLPNFLGDVGLIFSLPGSPLVWAMAMESEPYVKALIANGADVSRPPPNGIEPFKFACMPRHCRFLQLLSTSDTFHVSPEYAYYTVSKWGEMEMLRCNATPRQQEESLDLILNKAIPFLNIEAVEDFYKHLLLKTIEEAPLEIVDIVLLALRRSMATVADQDVVAYQFASKPLAHPIWGKYTFVQRAAGRGDPAVLRAVLIHGGDATDVDGFYRSGLHMVSLSSDNPECVDVLINYGALAVLNCRRQARGMTAFGEAVANCNFRVADRLLHYTSPEERQAILSAQSFQSEFQPSPLSLFGLFVASSSVLGPKPLEYLLGLPETQQYSDSLFIVDMQFRTTALMTASSLNCGPDIYNQELFAVKRRKESIQLLLKHFSEERHINFKNREGFTALHFAAWIGSVDIVKALLDAGAKINPVNHRRRTPLDMVFGADPPYLCKEREKKKYMISIFEASRNEICDILRSRGGRHNLPISIEDSWNDHTPFPWLHKRRAQEKLEQENKTDVD